MSGILCVHNFGISWKKFKGKHFLDELISRQTFAFHVLLNGEKYHPDNKFELFVAILLFSFYLEIGKHTKNTTYKPG